MSDHDRPPVEPMPQPAGQPPSPPGRPPTRTAIGQPDEPQQPSRVGPYEILGVLGRGWSAVIYRAYYPCLHRQVALKVLMSTALEDRQRFLREGRALASLGGHPHIVPIYEVGEYQGQPYLTMKLVESDLPRRLAQGIPPPHETALLISRVAQAVHHAHLHGIIHRDLKPGNVLLDTDGTPCLTGFWLARPMDPGTSPIAGAVLGTPAYMAPEQAQGKRDVGPLADIYALGAILYECLTGRPPFKAATVLETITQVLQSRPAAPQSINPQASDALAAVALKCLEKDPAKRYASAAEVAGEMERYLRDEPVQARSGGTMRRLVGWIRGG
jgi:serine/threonine-protein kinase